MPAAPQNGEIYPRRTGDLNEYYVDTAIRGAPKHTGFVPNLVDPETQDTQAFKLFSTHHEDPKLSYGSTFQQQAVIRVHTATPLNQAFFSDANIQYLQDEIRYRVWDKSEKKHVIDPQRADDLKTIMRAYYLQYQINDEKNAAKELNALNERVMKYCVDDILGSINMWLFNRSQTLNYPDQISRPINPHIYGTKGAEFKAFF
jgi:ribosomal protein S20